jgi:hypothetical protein
VDERIPAAARPGSKSFPSRELRATVAVKCTCIGKREGPAALRALIDAAEQGIAEAGGEMRFWHEGDPLEADAFLVAAPAILFGLPGEIKAGLDAWLALLPEGRLIPRTAGKPAGFLCIYEPDDEAIPACFEAQMRGMFGYLGMVYRGCAAGYAAPRASAPADGRLVRVARNLGAVLVRFNRGEFWEAHEVWEELWIREETELKLFYQGLIQIAGAFHHYGQANWGGMKSLLADGVEKVAAYRPFAQGIDVDALLAELAPFRDLAGARTGRAPAVTRIPGSPPRLELRG